MLLLMDKFGYLVHYGWQLGFVYVGVKTLLFEISAKEVYWNVQRGLQQDRQRRSTDRVICHRDLKGRNAFTRNPTETLNWINGDLL